MSTVQPAEVPFPLWVQFEMKGLDGKTFFFFVFGKDLSLNYENNVIVC